IYGVLSNCNIQNDVLTLQGTFGAAMAAKYENSATNPNPKIASIYAPATGGGAHPHISLVDGFRIQSLGSRNSLQSLGAIDYYAQVITNLYASLNCLLSGGAPVGVGDNPNNALVNFLALRSENPFRSGAAKITFGITKKEKVELKVYDVTGRLVKTLANREFDPGSHDLFWDGSNDDGQLVSKGVYFYQLRTPSYVSQKKLAVLKN
ncbi:MAG: T9SS type A sorting domain-containing protein, partial [Candidatus Eisenbacteria bacterium]|nr:T9SS type A sorting domain-containing protein [Candidatus Eisenbacteria bacterium]